MRTKLREELKRKRWKQDDAAGWLGISASAMSRYCTGRKALSEAHAKIIAKKIKTQWWKLMGFVTE